jgi:hypothetical protein
MRGGCFFLEGKALTGDAGMRGGGTFSEQGLKNRPALKYGNSAAVDAGLY